MTYHGHGTDMAPGAKSHLAYAPRVPGRFGMHAMVPVALVLWGGGVGLFIVLVGLFIVLVGLFVLWGGGAPRSQRAAKELESAPFHELQSSSLSCV